MTLSSPTLEPVAAEEARAAGVARAGRGKLHQYMALAKVRLNAMVLITAAVGFVMAAPGAINWTMLLLTLIGTGLAAVGASAFNQLMEVKRDAAMVRTRTRPLPSGAIGRMEALFFAVLTTDLGLAILFVFVNPLTALLGLINVLVYVLLYTPMKPRTSLNTLVGAICGALPPMMGWAAAVGELGLGAWLLGAILFIWQIPHFLALAWLYRDDYARGGYRMLPVVDQQGTLTGLMTVVYSLALLPLCVLVTLAGVAGWWFAAGSLVLGAFMCVLALKLNREKTSASARRLFLASVIYLPLLLVIMVADAKGPGGNDVGVILHERSVASAP